jgi:hypothetical protein
MSYKEIDGEILPSYAPDGSGNQPHYGGDNGDQPCDFYNQPPDERREHDWSLTRYEKQAGRLGVAATREVLKRANGDR